MKVNLNPIYMVLLVLCIIMLILGFCGYKKNRDMMTLLTSVVGLLSLSGVATLLGFKGKLTRFLTEIKLLSQLMATFELYKYWNVKKKIFFRGE